MINYKTVSPTRKDVEVILDPKNTFVSMTDTNGNIEYCNESFSRLTGFEVDSLIGSKHNKFRHDDMPCTLYKYIWSRLKKEEKMTAIIKNNNKNNDYYWSVVNFNIRRNKDGIVIGYKADRKPATKDAIKAISSLYEKLLILESRYNKELSLRFFDNYFEHKNVTYDGYIENLINPIKNDDSNIYANKTLMTKIKSFF